MKAQQRSSQALDWVQALRGIAAISVVICHDRNNLSPVGPDYDKFAQTYLRPLAQGVDLFFLVSCFIMVYTTQKSDGSLKYVGGGHFIKRFTRIWPVYAVFFAITLVLTITFLPSSFIPVPINWGSVFKSLFFWPVDPRGPPYYSLSFSTAWTLCFEMYFYFIFGLSMFARGRRWTVLFGWLLLTLVVLPIAHDGYVSMLVDTDYHFWFPYADLITNPVIWDFVVGMLAGFLHFGCEPIKSRVTATMLLLFTLAFIIWWSGPTRATYHGMMLWGGPLAILFILMVLTFKKHKPCVPRVLTWLGDISFSVYLLHLVAFDVIIFIFNLAGADLKSKSVAIIITLLCLPAAIALGYLSYLFLERGLSEWIRVKLIALLDKYTAPKSDQNNSPGLELEVVDSELQTPSQPKDATLEVAIDSQTNKMKTKKK